MPRKTKKSAETEKSGSPRKKRKSTAAAKPKSRNSGAGSDTVSLTYFLMKEGVPEQNWSHYRRAALGARVRLASLVEWRTLLGFRAQK